jgi:hypothetical protein
MKYPDSPRPIVPYNFRINRPFVGGGPEWASQNRALTRFNLFEADLNYRGRSWADAMVLYNFFESVHGPAGRFTFVDFNGIGPVGGVDPGVPWVNLFVAKGDGVTTTWDLPTYGAVAGITPIEYSPGLYMGYATPLVLVNGSISYSGSYAVSYGTGTDGVDSLEATSGAPSAGSIISVSATCRRALRRARFTTAKNPFVYNAVANYYQGPVTIVEVRK